LTFLAPLPTISCMKKALRRPTLDGRWAFVVWVIAFFGSTFAAGTHWLAVPHRLCEVHGTIEHGRAIEVAIPIGPITPGPRVRPLDAPHEECDLGPLARTEGVVPASIEQRGQFVAEECGRVVAPDAPVLSVPLFLLAPSRSPPA